MSLLQKIKYESRIEKLGDISSDEVPKAVLSMLHDVRTNIGKLDSAFLDVNLMRVLEVIEAGEYRVNGSASTCIDLFSAKIIIDTYRNNSEGGCQSCVNLGRETIDAQDATSGWYCLISDSDYNEDAIGDELGVRYSGFSPKIKKHYESPCDSWKPRFSPKLDELISQK